jgi:hypothetical protein
MEGSKNPSLFGVQTVPFFVPAQSGFCVVLDACDGVKLHGKSLFLKDFFGWGHVAEWLRNGLQNRVLRFNSGRGLQPSL